MPRVHVIINPDMLLQRQIVITTPEKTLVVRIKYSSRVHRRNSSAEYPRTAASDQKQYYVFGKQGQQRPKCSFTPVPYHGQNSVHTWLSLSNLVQGHRRKVLEATANYHLEPIRETRPLEKSIIRRQQLRETISR